LDVRERKKEEVAGNDTMGSFVIFTRHEIDTIARTVLEDICDKPI
jgi:hypothetical protein